MIWFCVIFLCSFSPLSLSISFSLLLCISLFVTFCQTVYSSHPTITNLSLSFIFKVLSLFLFLYLNSFFFHHFFFSSTLSFFLSFTLLICYLHHLPLSTAIHHTFDVCLLVSYLSLSLSISLHHFPFAFFLFLPNYLCLPLSIDALFLFLFISQLFFSLSHILSSSPIFLWIPILLFFYLYFSFDCSFFLNNRSQYSFNLNAFYNLFTSIYIWLWLIIYVFIVIHRFFPLFSFFFISVLFQFPYPTVFLPHLLFNWHNLFLLFSDIFNSITFYLNFTPLINILLFHFIFFLYFYFSL